MASTTEERANWCWWGVVAGVAGLVANILTDDQAGLSEQQRRSGAAVVRELERGSYHLGVVAGLVVVFALLMTATGWRRWAHSGGSGDLAEAAVSSALLTSAAALLVAYALRGALAEYLPGGINADNFPVEGTYVLFVINDTAPWTGWWGVIFAAALCTWLTFARRAFPVWLGVVSVLVVAVPVAILLTTGAAALAGLVGPVWLTVASAAAAFGGMPTRAVPTATPVTS